MNTPDEVNSPSPGASIDAADAEDAEDMQREDTRARIVAGARERYLRGQRMELTTLAADHGISRATAYRWFGDNERLLAEVLGERVRDNFLARMLEHADKSGRDRVLAVVEGVLRYSALSERLEVLLRREPSRVLRILASSAHGLQRMEVDLLETLLSDEHAAGHLVARRSA